MRRLLPLILFTLAALTVPAEARVPDAYGRQQRWIGKPVTIKATEVDLADLFRLIADASGFNIVVGDGVTGKMRAISWEDVPWDQALDMILKTKHLHAERSGNMLRIVSNEEFLREMAERSPAVSTQILVLPSGQHK
jgi:type IV pilus assembly protein PilQ